MRIVIADPLGQRTEELRRIVLGEGLTCEPADVVTFDTLAPRLAEVEPQLVMVVHDAPVARTVQGVRLAHAATAAPIIVVGPEASVPADALLQAGARVYLTLDTIRHTLREHVATMEAEAASVSVRGKIVSLFSPSGGCGVTTTAINLAARLAVGRPGQVALADLKSSPSDLALLLDIKPTHTVDDLAPQWQRLDRKMLAAAMVRHAAGLDVLAQAGFPTIGGLPPHTLSPESVRQILTLLRRTYPVTVVDLDHTLTPDQVEAMQHSNFVGLVARPDVVGLRRARWALDTAAALGIRRERFRLILNRYGQRGQLSVAQAEEILGLKVFQAIPEDHAAVNRAINQGVLLNDAGRFSRINRSFAALARNV